MREHLKTKKDIAIFITAIIVILIGIALIINIISTQKSINKIIQEAKLEAEEKLISSGVAKYTEDIVNNNENSTSTISEENLSENTAENPQNIGTIVAPKENWNIETVTAISVGNGDTVPVPKGFYYVGGDLNTGVIISDDERDQYDGTTDKTTWEYTISLKGNQFVWIPCTEEEYKKNDVWNGTTQKTSGTTSGRGTLCYGGWDKTTYTSELPQIRKYGGFYVGRYEAGLAKDIPEFTETQGEINSNQVYNLEGIPQSKAGVIPWMFIDANHAQGNAKNMYNTKSISSGLITGTQWDVMLKKLVEKTDLTEADLTDSKNWGNLQENSIEYKGRMANAGNANGGYLTAFGEEREGRTTVQNGELLTTGASRQTEKYHIFDVAGNLWEITDEISLYKQGNAKETNIQYNVLRGEGYVGSFELAVCYRYGEMPKDMVDWSTGFRVVLYIK